MTLPLTVSELFQIIGFLLAGGFAYSRIMSRLADGDKRFDRIEGDIRAKQNELDNRVRSLESTERINGLALQEVKTKVEVMTKAIEKMESKMDENFKLMFAEMRNKVDVSFCESNCERRAQAHHKSE